MTSDENWLLPRRSASFYQWFLLALSFLNQYAVWTKICWVELKVIDWTRGGWTGSINKLVRLEVREHFRENLVARRARYRFAHRLLKKFFSIGAFGHFIGLYILLDFASILAEGVIATCCPDCVSNWIGNTSEQAIKEFLRNVASYLITAQVGVLGVISIALALVTLIAQRENSSTDVKVYYHESFAFEVVASSIALLAVLVTQLFWPAQALLSWLELDLAQPVFEVGLLGFHLFWLLLNLAGLAHFISTTFGFVQQSEREFLRNRYTANVIQPLEMTKRLREHFYALASKELDGDDNVLSSEKPRAAFGFDFGAPHEIELELVFAHPTSLHDVRMNCVRWVLRRWAARSADAATRTSETADTGGRPQSPMIWFTPHLDRALVGNQGWCQRRGGVPLSPIEKFVLRWAFSFRKTDEDA